MIWLIATCLFAVSCAQPQILMIQGYRYVNAYGQNVVAMQVMEVLMLDDGAVAKIEYGKEEFDDDLLVDNIDDPENRQFCNYIGFAPLQMACLNQMMDSKKDDIQEIGVLNDRIWGIGLGIWMGLVFALMFLICTTNGQRDNTQDEEGEATSRSSITAASSAQPHEHQREGATVSYECPVQYIIVPAQPEYQTLQ